MRCGFCEQLNTDFHENGNIKSFVSLKDLSVVSNLGKHNFYHLNFLYFPLP